MKQSAGQYRNRKCFWKKALSVFLTAIIFFGSVDVTAIAAEPYRSENSDSENSNSEFPGGTTDGTEPTGVLEGSDISVHRDNSLGRIFGDAIADSGSVSAAAETGCSVYAVYINGTTATVSFQTVEDGALVVGVYEESGERLLATGSAYVSAGDTEALVSIETQTLPEYFYVRAFLTDAQNFRPFCEVYESEDYTQKMQEFYAKTTADFDAEQILNLDEDIDNNFLVFSDSVKVIPRGEDETVNMVEECDEENLVYKIGNPDVSFTALQAGDIFAYYYGDNQAIITEVVSLEQSETDGKSILTISGTDPDFEQIIAFIKVGAENPREDSAEPHTADAAMESAVMGEQLYAHSTIGDIERERKWSLPDWEPETGTDGISLSVSDIGGIATMRVFRDSKEKIQTAELEISYGAKIKLEAEVLSAEKRWKVGNPEMPTNVPGVKVGCKLEIKLEFTGSVNVEGSIAGAVGVRVTEKKIENISRAPEFTVTEGVEASVKLGLVISPRIKFIHEKILSCAVEVDFGIKLTLTANKKRFDTAAMRHVCSVCFSITLNPYLTITGKFTILRKKNSVELYDKDLPFNINAYFSPEYAPHFGWGECPHWIYNGAIQVVDSAGKPVADAVVKSSVSEGTTDSDGKTELRLNLGRQNLYVEKDGIRYSQSVEVSDKTGAVMLQINTSAVQTLSASTDVKEVYAASALYSGIYAAQGVAYAALTKDASLYMWGENCNRGRLGNGKMDGSQDMPLKVLDKVKDFQFSPDGMACVAIRTDGSLYTWGGNAWALGNGGTATALPEQVKALDGKKIEKVSFFSCIRGDSVAAITTEGDLYMWGAVEENSLYREPQYIMNDVEEVIVGYRTFGAITKTKRSLFLWGYNYEGVAGQYYDRYRTETQTVSPSDYQEKGLGAMLDGVQEVYLGSDIGVALKQDGSLWMWGKGYSSGDEEVWNAKKLVATDISQFYWNATSESNTFSPDMTYAAVTKEGELYMWGNNAYGQLGTGDTASATEPQKVTGIENVRSFYICAEGDMKSVTCAAVTGDGKLYMWGKNVYGQLGTGGTSPVYEPRQVAGIDKVKSFHMENFTCAAVTEDGKLYMWGRNEGGSVGNGKQEICSQPVSVLSEENVERFQFLFDDTTRLSVAFTKSNDIYMWGAYNGSPASGSYDYSATAIYTPEKKLEKADKLIPYFGSKFACVRTDGTLYESVYGINDGYFLEDLDESVKEAVCQESHTGGDTYYRSYFYDVIVKGSKGGVYTWTEDKVASTAPDIKTEYFFGGADILKPLPEEKAQSAVMTLSAETSLQLLSLEGDAGSMDSEDVSRTAEFTGLRSNEIYNVYAMKSKTAEQAFSSDNLLYIGQWISDDSGSLQVAFEMKESYAEPEIFCVGLSCTDISEAEVEVADIVYDGESHLPEVTVKYNGRILVQGTDYNVYFQEYAKEIGEYELLVEGTGLFRGKQAVKFCVKEKKDDGGDTPGGDDKPGENDKPGGDDNPSKPDYGDVLPQDVPQDGVIPTGLWIAGVEEAYNYTGSAIRPEVRVYDSKTLLVEKTDYTIAYKNNVQANDVSVTGKAPTITVTGKGNYTGKDTKTFQILQLDISSESEENLFEADDMVLAYSSKAQKPVPELYRNGKKLKNRTDYTITYHKGSYSGADTEELPSVQEPGNYYIRLSGNKNYTGTRRVKLVVLPAQTDSGEVKSIARVKVAKIPSQLYQTENKNSAVTPEVMVNDGSRTLTNGVHYTVSYSNNKKVGTAYAIIKGIEANGYSGTKRISFKITGIAIKKASVTGLQTFVYDGAAKEPQLTLSVKINGTDTPLVKDRDYSVQWQKNVNAGTASVVFTGKNGYTGTLKKTFKIKAFSLAENQDGRFRAELADTSVPYAKGGARPALTVTFRQLDGSDVTLKEGKDYTVSYQNNKALNDGSGNRLPTLTIRGKGNFTGVYPTSLTYRITAQDISRLTLSASDKVYQNRGNIYPTKVTITDLDGKVLKAGTDYDKNLTYTYKNNTTLPDGTLRAAGTVVTKTDIIPAGTIICVAAVPKGNYTGTSLIGEYSIRTYNISGAKVTIPAQIYTGSPITLDKTDESQILVRAGGRKVNADQFEIVRYSNNVKKGTATVTIRGIGNYGGEKTVKFKIKAKGFLWWWNR